MVGIWSEFGRNDSESESNLGGLSLTSHSYQIPTIPTIPLGFRSEFGRIRSECVGESKVLLSCPVVFAKARRMRGEESDLKVRSTMSVTVDLIQTPLTIVISLF